MEWRFDKLESGSIEGWNHAGLAQFKATTLQNLVRETLQNSLDNPNSLNDEETPVRVSFIEHSIERNKVPGLDELVEHLKECKKDSKDTNDEVKKGIDAALNLSQKQNLKILEIADFNTTGMPGPATRHKPFHNYLKTDGDSTPDSSRGGSHGLGKFAPIVNTQLRTIFVSTAWEEDSERKILFQGLTILAGRQNQDGTSTAQRGYFGTSDFMPLEAIPNDFKWMERAEVGTSIYLVGWDSPEHWNWLLAGYALTNFFAAFSRKKLEITVQKIGGRKEIVVVGKNNFETFFDNQDILFALDGSTDGGSEKLRNAKFYLECVKESDDVISQETQINSGVGASVVRILLHDDAPQKIAFVRNNIFITDQIPFFYKRQSREFHNFSGVFEVENKDGARLLRSMENPSHTKLDQDWLPPEERKHGKKALTSLGNKLKGIIKEKAQIQAETGPGPIEILKEFFADEAGDGIDNIENEDINPAGKFRITLKRSPLAPPEVISAEEREDEEDSIDSDEDGGLGGSTDGGGGGGGGDGSSDGDGTGGTGTKSTKKERGEADSLKLETKRVLSIKDKEIYSILRSVDSVNAKLSVQEIGADFSEDLKVNKSSSGKIEKDGSSVVVSINGGQPLNLKLTCENLIVGGVKLIARKVDEKAG